MRRNQPPSRRCCLPVGLARARDLANGRPLSWDTVRRMANFDRHRRNYKPGYPTKGTQAWLLWGGTEGIDWAKAIVAETRTDAFGLHRRGKKRQTKKLNCKPSNYQCGNACIPKEKECGGAESATSRQDLLQEVQSRISQKKGIDTKPIKGAIQKESVSQTIGNLLSLLTDSTVIQSTVGATGAEILANAKIPRNLQEVADATHATVKGVRSSLERIAKGDLPDLDIQKALSDPKVRDLILETTIPEAVFWTVAGVAGTQFDNPTIGTIAGAQAKKATRHSIQALRNGNLSQVLPLGLASAGTATQNLLQKLKSAGNLEDHEEILLSDLVLGGLLSAATAGEQQSILAALQGLIHTGLSATGLPDHATDLITASTGYVAKAALAEAKNQRSKQRADALGLGKKQQSKKLNCGPDSHQCGNACVPKEKECDDGQGEPGADQPFESRGQMLEAVQSEIAERKAEGKRTGADRFAESARSAVSEEINAVGSDLASQGVAHLVSMVTDNEAISGVLNEVGNAVIGDVEIPTNLKDIAEAARNGVAGVRELVEGLSQGGLKDLDLKSLLSNPKVREILMETALPEAAFWGASAAATAVAGPVVGAIAGTQAKKLTKAMASRPKDEDTPEGKGGGAGKALRAVGESIKEHATEKIKEGASGAISAGISSLGVPSFISDKVGAAATAAAGNAAEALLKKVRKTQPRKTPAPAPA